MIRKFLDLSTAHLTLATRQALDALPPDSLPFAGGAHPFGWFAHCPDEFPNRADHIPDDLWQVMQHARALGCDYVMLDADADAIDGLPVYDDEQTHQAEGRNMETAQ